MTGLVMYIAPPSFTVNPKAATTRLAMSITPRPGRTRALHQESHDIDCLLACAGPEIRLDLRRMVGCGYWMPSGRTDGLHIDVRAWMAMQFSCCIQLSLSTLELVSPVRAGRWMQSAPGASSEVALSWEDGIPRTPRVRRTNPSSSRDAVSFAKDSASSRRRFSTVSSQPSSKSAARSRSARLWNRYACVGGMPSSCPASPIVRPP
jgi:hypothetical protein